MQSTSLYWDRRLIQFIGNTRIHFKKASSVEIELEAIPVGVARSVRTNALQASLWEVATGFPRRIGGSRK